MRTIPYGKTGLTPTKTGFGALPLQRRTLKDAIEILQFAYEGGFRVFDTARAYSDSEEKMGLYLSGIRERIVLATKTIAQTGEGLFKDLRESLKMLRTDYIDLYQLHNPAFVPRPGGADGLYDAALEAKRQGLIRHIGITQHSLERANEAVRSGLYDTLQYPFNHLATREDIALVSL